MSTRERVTKYNFSRKTLLLTFLFLQINIKPILLIAPPVLIIMKLGKNSLVWLSIKNNYRKFYVKITTTKKVIKKNVFFEPLLLASVLFKIMKFDEKNLIWFSTRHNCTIFHVKIVTKKIIKKKYVYWIFNNSAPILKVGTNTVKHKSIN